MILFVLLSVLYTACTVYTMLRVRTEASREFVWRPALGVDNPEWQGTSKEMGQHLENFSPPMIWKSTPEQLQDPVKTISYVKGKGSDSSRDAQLTATCWALAIAYQTVLGMVQHFQEEEKRNKSTGTLSAQTTSEPEGKGNKSAGTVCTQTIAEPEGQPKLVAVAPVQKRKSA